MERPGRHPPKAVTVVTRAALVSEETGSAFYPGGGVIHLLSYTVLPPPLLFSYDTATATFATTFVTTDATTQVACSQHN